MPKNNSYHPTIIINDHFEDVINLIDIQTEILLEDQSLNEDKINELNTLRNKQLEKIKEIQELNLFLLPKFDEEKYQKKWSDIINDETLEYQHKLDLIKDDLIIFDCVLVEDFQSKSKITLLVTSWFYNLRNLDFLWFV